MPIYEFVCQTCGKRFSELLAVTDSLDSVICMCGSTSVRKAVSSFRRGRGEDEKINEISDRVSALGDDATGTEMESMMREVGKALDEDASEQMVEIFEKDMDSSKD